MGRLLSREPENRPSIHELLWFPIVQSRISDLLSQSLRRREFSHTVLHGHVLLGNKPQSNRVEPPSPQSPPTPVTVEALNRAKQEEGKRVELLEAVQRQQLTHTMNRQQASAAAASLVRQLPEREREQEEAKVQEQQEVEAQIYELQIALLQHPSEARIIDIPEPTTPQSDRDDDFGESSPFARTSGMGKVEAMRQLLEGQLGEEKFVAAYNVIKHIEDTMGPDSWDITLLYEKLRGIMREEEVEQAVPKIQVLLDLESRSH